MTTVSLILPEVGKPDSTQDPRIVTAFTTLQTWANGNVDSTNLSKGAVNGEAVNKEVPRFLSTAKPEAMVAFLNNTEYEASATRPVFVTARVGRKSNTTVTMELFVGGVLCMSAQLNGAGETEVGWPVSFLVPPAAKWKIVTAGTGAGTLERSYLTL
jgi:hypothetical protein